MKSLRAALVVVFMMAASACSASGGGEVQVQTKSFPHGISSVLLICGFGLVIVAGMYAAALMLFGGRGVTGRSLVAVNIGLVAGTAAFGAAVVLWFIGQ